MEGRTRAIALAIGLMCVVLGVAGWILYRPLAGSGDDLGSGAPFAIWGAVAILAVGVARPGSLQAGSPTVGPCLALALSGPLAILPLSALPDRSALVAVALMWPLSALPLGIVLASSASRPVRWAASAAAAAGTAATLGIVPALIDIEHPALLGDLRLLAIVAVGLVPALAVASSRPDESQSRATARPGSTAVHAATVVGGLAPLAGASVLVLPGTGTAVLVASLLAFVLVSQLTVRPLTWAATQAAAQRDLTVAVVEAERRRLAADIHDGPLQTLLLLGRRLEQEGDLEGAAIARSISTELRDLGGELRLPILDDLGVGPALDWLAERVRRMTGMEISVEYQGLRRPPPEVELAAFRIAQEALSNAIRHGEPPIQLSYRTTGDSISLSVDDAGRGGIGGVGEERSVSTYGLLNMQQRAEQIGARLELQHRVERGTHVGIEWKATPA
jgi:signal transduction histidine kinase